MKAESVELVYVLTNTEGERWFESEEQLNSFCKESGEIGTKSAKLKIIFPNGITAVLKPDTVID